jgi:hypothetical protein
VLYARLAIPQVATESHAIAHVDKTRSSNCVVLAFVTAALCGMCIFVGRFESHAIMDGAGSLSSQGPEDLNDHAADFARDFVRFRWVRMHMVIAVFVTYCTIVWLNHCDPHPGDLRILGNSGDMGKLVSFRAARIGAEPAPPFQG